VKINSEKVEMKMKKREILRSFEISGLSGFCILLKREPTN
jgi:hypothetical protein